MSASEKKEKGTTANLSGDKDNYYFNLPYAIPCYLIALAVGDLASAEIGPRSRVWTEPCQLVCKNCMQGLSFIRLKTNQILT